MAQFTEYLQAESSPTDHSAPPGNNKINELAQHSDVQTKENQGKNSDVLLGPNSTLKNASRSAQFQNKDDKDDIGKDTMDINAENKQNSRMPNTKVNTASSDRDETSDIFPDLGPSQPARLENSGLHSISTVVSASKAAKRLKARRQISKDNKHE